MNHSCRAFSIFAVSTLATIAGCASKETTPSPGRLVEPRVRNEYTTPTIYWEWFLVSLDGAPFSGERGMEMTIWPTGQITGHGGVNKFSAAADPARLDTGEFSINPILGTKMAGPEIPMREEQQFFDALQRATTLRLDNDVLILRSGTSEVARFRASSRRPMSKEELDQRIADLVDQLKKARGEESNDAPPGH